MPPTTIKYAAIKCGTVKPRWRVYKIDPKTNEVKMLPLILNRRQARKVARQLNG